jgi:hypothetical protein
MGPAVAMRKFTLFEVVPNRRSHWASRGSRWDLHCYRRGGKR